MKFIIDYLNSDGIINIYKVTAATQEEAELKFYEVIYDCEGILMIRNK